MRSRRRLALVLGFGLAALAGTAAGCRSDFKSECPAGQEDCPCVGGSGGSCLEGLECASNTCVDISGTETSASQGDAGSETAQSASGSADTSEATDTDLDTTSESDADSETGSETGSPDPTVCPSFFDTFDDASIDPLWRQTFPASASELGGELVINVTGALNDEYVTMALLPEAVGLEGGTMRVELGTVPTEIGVRTTLWVRPTTNTGGVSYNLVDRGVGLQLEARITPEVGSPQIVSTLEWTAGAMDWLQLREADGMLYFEFSPDGVGFEVFHEMPTPFDVGSAELGFAGHNDDVLPSDVELSVETFEFICG